MLRFLSLSLRWGQNNNQPKTRRSKALSHSKRFYANRNGTIAVMFGLLLPIFVGLLGLGVDVPNWYLAKRKAQTAVDAGAISGAYALFYNDNSYEAEYAAADGAKRNEFVADSGRTLTVNIPPLSGPYTGDASAVEVIGTELQTVYLASVIMDDKVDIQARAVAAAYEVNSDVCVLGLDPAMEGTVWFTGTSTTEVGCDVHSNSSDDQSIRAGGTAAGTLGNVTAVGQINMGSNTNFGMYEASPLSWMLPVKDPYGADEANLQVPSSPVGCDFTTLVVRRETTTLAPGRYCDGLHIAGSSDVTFDSGTYLIDGGILQVGGGSTVFGEEVTFVLTGSGSDYAVVEFRGNSVIDLSAPTSGEFEGVLFFQDPDAPADYLEGVTYEAYTNKFNGGSDLHLVGTIYIPNQEVWFQGGTSITDSCIQIVARRVIFNGNGAVGKNNCPNDMQLADIKVTRIKLVE